MQDLDSNSGCSTTDVVSSLGTTDLKVPAKYNPYKQVTENKVTEAELQHISH